MSIHTYEVETADKKIVKVIAASRGMALDIGEKLYGKGVRVLGKIDGTELVDKAAELEALLDATVQGAKTRAELTQVYRQEKNALKRLIILDVMRFTDVREVAEVVEEDFAPMIRMPYAQLLEIAIKTLLECASLQKKGK